jgi:glycosyltransferase involved in cell wall biosynthesis
MSQHAVEEVSQRGSEAGPLPTPSIVIEWENVALAGDARANQMLDSLGEQLHDLADRFSDTPEVIVLYDADEVDGEALRGAVYDRLKRGTDIPNIPFTVELLTNDGEYYEQKNRGARHANRDVLVFLDSDVIPERGWLEHLVAPFDDHMTRVVAGHTYVVDDSLYEKAFKYFWFFPTREQTRDRWFFANNVAFRRDVFLDYGFPDTETFRGQCTELATRLQRDGVGVRQAHEAVCSHPAPNGVRHFAIHALCTGHDNEIRARRPDESTARGLLRAGGQFVVNTFVAGKRIVTRRRATGSEGGVPFFLGVFVLATCYNLFELLGQALTVVDSDVIGRRLQM